MKRVNVKTTSDGEAYLDLADFKDMLDIKQVVSYTIEEIDDGGARVLLLSFYDNDGELVRMEDGN